MDSDFFENSQGEKESNLLLFHMLLIVLPALQPTPAAQCNCVQARTTNGWCSACRVGYVAGLKIPSLLMYDALDAHGHAIDPKRMTCTSCRKALATDGFCNDCRMGFIKRKAYLSRLTYYVAKGTVVTESDINCARCRSHLGTTGWCDDCQRGIVGNIAHTNRFDFDSLAEEYRRLAAAVARIKECESCAVAGLTNGRCMTCRKVFENGEAKPLPRP